jgi:undecaprenyl phosphate N,N'-diacetylbacillosamine 1-phosphate transferase
MKYEYLKRGVDLIASLSALIALSPFFAIVGAAIRTDSAGPVFFRQRRTGKNARPFKVFKFRTMVDNAEKIGSGIFTDTVDPRITRVGRLLRNTSLDELPQLLNVFKGDMSLIGPRPVPFVRLDGYDHSDTRRLVVKPGISGWAQVNGRNTLTWPEKIEKDMYYIEHISFLLDVKIVIKTVGYLVTRKGIYSGRYRNLVNQHAQS